MKYHPFQNKFAEFYCILLMDVILISVQPRKLVMSNTNTNSLLKLPCNASGSEGSEGLEGSAFCSTSITKSHVAQPGSPCPHQCGSATNPSAPFVEPPSLE